MHWYQWSSICTVKSGPSLSEPQGPIHQLHLRGWQPGTNMVTRRALGFEFFATHKRSDRICIDHSCGRQQNCVTPTANHSGPNSIQIGREGGRVFAFGHVIKNEQSRIASTKR